MRSALVLLVACGSKTEPTPPSPVVPPEAALPDAAIDAPSIDAPELPALEMRRLEGPYASVAAYCKAKPEIDEPGYKTRCDVEPIWTGKRRGSPKALFDEARLFVVEGLDPHCELGLRTGTAWFVLHDAIRCLGDRAKSSLETKVTTFTTEDGRSELVLHAVYDQSTREYSPEDYETWHFETRIYCGKGPTGHPSCTRELPVRGRFEHHAPVQKTRKADFDLDIRLGVDQIELVGETAGLDPFLISPLAAGTYALRFP